MKKINIRGWNKKPRTMLRFIKIGDIFCFEYSDNKFAFGQIIGKSISGHIAIIFNLIKDSPEILGVEIGEASVLGSPIIINSYGFFDKKNEGNWQIIGHEEDIDLSPYSHVAFRYGMPDGSKFGKVDISGKVYPKEFSPEEAKNWKPDSPMTDLGIKEYIIENLG